MSHLEHFESSTKTGHALMLAGHQNADEIQTRLDVLKNQWDALQQLVAGRKQRLQDSEEGHQVEKSDECKWHNVLSLVLR